MSAHKIALGHGHGRSLRRLAAAVYVGVLGWGCGVVGLGAARAADADVVVLNGRVYTAGPGRSFAQAIAVAGDKIVYVGDDAGAWALTGRQTKIEDVGGRLILPGLIDTHVHPTGGLYPVDICDLKSQAKTLAELTAFVKGCLARYSTAPGEWLVVSEWEFGSGDQPDPAHPTLRAALDAASLETPIELIGNDFHHGAYNSAALRLAKTFDGQVVGYSAATLSKEFASLAKLIGVDANGEPNGAVNEDARNRMRVENPAGPALAAVLKDPARTMRVLNHDGITAIQDAAAGPSEMSFYEGLEARGQLTVRVNLALLYHPEDYRLPDHSIDYDRVVGYARSVRTHFAADPLIRAEAVKMFADGVLEGDPRSDPPTLPESPSIAPYLQPIFDKNASGDPVLKGYVDTGSSLCARVRQRMGDFASPDAVSTFTVQNGYRPAQCQLSNGKLQHERGVILEYLKRMHMAGFTLHIHAIGDDAVRVAVDGIEEARRADGVATQPDAIAHLQLVARSDVDRIDRDHIFTDYTFSWAFTDPGYDRTVIPFVQHVDSLDYAALHLSNSYYERQAYPTRSTMQAGGVLVAGSDAPVDERDPQPFVNIQSGVTRQTPGRPPLGPQERLDVRDVIDAYTVNGARALNRQMETGSIEAGKSADFIVLDRDIIALADGGRADQIGGTKVVSTWFGGHKVYDSAAAPPPP